MTLSLNLYKTHLRKISSHYLNDVTNHALCDTRCEKISFSNTKNAAVNGRKVDRNKEIHKES